MSEILNRFDDSIVFKNDNITLKELFLRNKHKMRDCYIYELNLQNSYLKNIDLQNSELIESNFKFATFVNVNLSNANLANANLANANLANANLSNANLANANLSNANLANANLSNANLANANLANTTLSLYCRWVISYTINSKSENIGIDDIVINIGCKSKTIKQWDLWFNSDKEYLTKRNTFEFKQIQACYQAYKIYLETLYK